MNLKLSLVKDSVRWLSLAFVLVTIGFPLLLSASLVDAQTWPYCYPGNTDCTSDRVKFYGFVLDMSEDCVDDMATATLYIDVEIDNDVYKFYAVATIHTDDDTIYDKEVFELGDRSKTDGRVLVPVVTFQWPCGESLYIQDLYIGYGNNVGAAYGNCNTYGQSFCDNDIPDQQVLIPGITIAKVVLTPFTNCTCSEGTEFQFSLTGPNNFDQGTTFYCDGGEFTFTRLEKDKPYVATEIVPGGWILTDISCSSTNYPTPPSCNKDVPGAKATITPRDGENVRVEFTDTKCQWADPGDDKIVCAGDTINLEGFASCYNTAGWNDDSCQGTLIPDMLTATYTPPLTGESYCKLWFNVTGACEGDYNGSMMVYVVPQPDPVIQVL